MAAYKGQYLLKNPFLQSNMLRRAKMGFANAKEMQQHQEDLYTGALEHGAKQRNVYLDTVMPTHMAEKEVSEQEVAAQTYAGQHQKQAGIAKAWGASITGAKAKTYKGGKSKRAKHKFASISARTRATQFAAEEAKKMAKRHGGEARAEEYRFEKRRVGRNVFFGGEEFGGLDVNKEKIRERAALEATTGIYASKKKKELRHSSQMQAWQRRDPETFRKAKETRDKIIGTYWSPSGGHWSTGDYWGFDERLKGASAAVQGSALRSRRDALYQRGIEFARQNITPQGEAGIGNLYLRSPTARERQRREVRSDWKISPLQSRLKYFA